MSTPFTPATTINEVITALNHIITTSRQTRSRLGYFAILYLKVTEAVQTGIANNQFQDGPRMERLDVTFANRYLHAYYQWQNRQQPTRSWQLAFEAAEKRTVLILEHLLLGMSAHINLDLGIAAAQTAGAGTAAPTNTSSVNATPASSSADTAPAQTTSIPAPAATHTTSAATANASTTQMAATPPSPVNAPLEAIHTDYNILNDIIGGLTYQVLAALNQVSPLLSFLGFYAGNSNSVLIQFSIVNARDGAWCFAEEIYGKTGAALDQAIVERDNNIFQLGTSLIHQKGLLAFTVWIIHLWEMKNPVKVMDILSGQQKTHFTVGRNLAVAKAPTPTPSAAG